MKTLIDRALYALKILVDVIFIILMAFVLFAGAGAICSMFARVFMFGYNLMSKLL